jgi:tRNA G18 (ribose-2'-O)-methylase SpoU
MKKKQISISAVAKACKVSTMTASRANRMGRPILQNENTSKKVEVIIGTSGKGVRYSVYCDTDKFMEIEAAGGCPKTITQGTVLSLEVLTELKQQQ